MRTLEIGLEKRKTSRQDEEKRQKRRQNETRRPDDIR